MGDDDDVVRRPFLSFASTTLPLAVGHSILNKAPACLKQCVVVGNCQKLVTDRNLLEVKQKRLHLLHLFGRDARPERRAHEVNVFKPHHGIEAAVHVGADRKAQGPQHRLARGPRAVVVVIARHEDRLRPVFGAPVPERVVA